MNHVKTVLVSLKMLLTGQAGVQDMTGPVGIVGMMSETASASKTTGLALVNLLWFGGFIAINLGVMNLLPIPALDGGRVFGLLVTSVIEAITKKKLDPKYEGYIHGVGMILLLALMGVVTDTVAASPLAASLSQTLNLSTEQIGMKAGMLVSAVFPILGVILLLIAMRYFKKKEQA